MQSSSQVGELSHPLSMWSDHQPMQPNLQNTSYPSDQIHNWSTNLTQLHKNKAKKN